MNFLKDKDFVQTIDSLAHEKIPVSCINYFIFNYFTAIYIVKSSKYTNLSIQSGTTQVINLGLVDEGMEIAIDYGKR